MPLNSPNFLPLAHALADVAREAIRPQFRQKIDVENKSAQGFDPVTRADRDAEAAMRALITADAPTHGIYGEEFGAHHIDADYVWYLDPIDGTRAFISGQPLWGVLIGLAYQGRLILGMLDQPYIDERVYACQSTDNGAFWRHKVDEARIKTRACAALKDAIIATTAPEMFDDAPAIWTDIKKRARLVRYGGDCYNYALLAAGHIDAVIEQGLRAYDIFPLIPIIEAAGGCVTNWRGQSLTQDESPSLQVIACGDGALHQAILPHLAQSHG